MWFMRLSVAFALGCFVGTFPFLAAGDTGNGNGRPLEVCLLRPDSLAGWDHGDPPQGWTIAGGRLSGGPRSTPLLSGYSFGDFDLRLRWSVALGAKWKLRFLRIPTGDSVDLTLSEGEDCGKFTDTPFPAPGSDSPPPSHGGPIRTPTAQEAVPPAQGPPAARDAIARAASHSAALHRRGERLSIIVDGRLRGQVELPPSLRLGLGLAVSGGQAELSDFAAEEPPGRPIFNGRDLAGWWTPGDLRDWNADGGDLVLTPHSGNYIRTEKLFGNFTLSLEYKAQKGCNSGVGIRTPRMGWPSADGMELQIWDTPLSSPIDMHSAMAIYGNVPPFDRADRSGQWNRVVIKADGWMISAWVNGELVQQSNTLDHPELKHRNLKGWIGFQDHGSWIRYREIRVLEAPDGAGLAVWSRPKPLRATAAVIDRIMNPESLSMADGITSGAITQEIVAADKPARVSLAGPGALVRVTQSGPQARLAFYFDGEPKPRIECKASELARHAPSMTDDPSPCLTCLTYKRRLDVVLGGTGGSECRLDYVNFPPQYQLESFTAPDSGFPRGWLGSVSYRHGQGAWGIHREFDPAPRAASPKMDLDPGATADLIEIRGSGVVQWVKLQADNKLLLNNDLWLEAIVDGTTTVSAPARFWFPALAGQEKADNFVMTDRGGPTIRLAMPYRRGLKLQAANHGRRAIHHFGAMVSYEPVTDENRAEILGRMQLRGIYQPPSRSTAELFHQEGFGRWVGWITELPNRRPNAAGGGLPAGTVGDAVIDSLGIESLHVDGNAAPGWNMPNLDLLLGRSGDFRSCLSGRHGRLLWQYLWLAPVEFQQTIVLRTTTSDLGGRLAWFYVRTP